MKTTTTEPVEFDHEMIEQFLKDSGVWLDIQQQPPSLGHQPSGMGHQSSGGST